MWGVFWVQETNSVTFLAFAVRFSGLDANTINHATSARIRFTSRVAFRPQSGAAFALTPVAPVQHRPA